WILERRPHIKYVDYFVIQRQQLPIHQIQNRYGCHCFRNTGKTKSGFWLQLFTSPKPILPARFAVMKLPVRRYVRELTRWRPYIASPISLYQLHPLWSAFAASRIPLDDWCLNNI